MRTDELFRYARELERLGRAEDALEDYGEFVDARLGGSEPLLRRARLLQHLGRHEQADSELREDVLLYASELEESGDTDRALAEYRSLEADAIGGIEPSLRCAELLRRIGRGSEAEASLRTAADRSPDDARPLACLAQIASDTGRPWLASHYIMLAMHRDPRQVEYRIRAADLAMSLDWFDRAHAWMRGLPADLPGGGEGVRHWAHVNYSERYAEAVARIRLRGKQDDHILDEWELAIALFRVGRVRMARRLCEIVMRDRPHSFAAFELCAKIIVRQQGVGAAIDFLEAVRFLHDHEPDYRRMISLLGRQRVQD